MSKFVT